MSAPLQTPPRRPEGGAAAPPKLELVHGHGVDLGVAATRRQDLGAGIVVFLVALPLCLGIALASTAPLMSGIITGIIGGIVVARASGSALLVSGPAAGLTAIVVAAIAQLGSFEAFLTAVVLAGLMQLGLGALRAGIIGYFFPTSVIKGMLAGIGLILIAKQLPYALGAGLAAGGAGGADGQSASETATAGILGWRALGETLAAIRPGALLLAVVSLAILVAWERPFMKRARKLMPAPLLVVVLGVAANALFVGFFPQLALPPEALVQLPVLDGLGSIGDVLMFPDWSVIGSSAVWTVAATLALVASLETLLSMEATDKLDPLKRRSPANRELFAQGLGNSLAGLVGGLPMTGVIVRSAANVGAGGRTWRSAFFHGVLLVGAVVAMASVLNLIPLATLAAILLFTGYKLANPKLLRDAAKVGPSYLVPFVVTVVGILATDLLVGIALGLVVATAFLLRESFRNAYFFHREESADHHRVRLELAEEVTFLNKARIHAVLHDLEPGTDVTVDGRRVRHIDHDVVEILHDFADTARSKDITLRLVGIPAVTAPASSH